MAKPKVFVFAPADPTGVAHKMLEDAGCELILGRANWDTPMGNDEAEMAKLAQGCDAMMGTSIRSTPITQRIMQASKNLRIVAKFTIGVDDVDVDGATEMGILVTHGPTESNWGGVAEGTITNMLTLLKKARERDRYLKTTTGWRDMKLQGTFVGYREEDGYPGITLGIIGLGRIGTRVAKLMRPWGMRMIGYDPYVPDSKFQQSGVERIQDLPSLLKQADVVTLHVVLTKETRHMMNAETVAMMKPSAILINTSRGSCVDEKAVAAALLDNKIAGAALDVFETEPIAADSPFRKMDDRVLISPHMVSSNHGSGLKTGLLWGTQSVISALKGEVPSYVYNTEVIDQWKTRFAGKSIL
jgi:D-3-phosphoglycerate dehydrogenase / 2-oxoglutarate reductase